MHVVGARFANLESANAALGEIRASVAIPRADVAVRPLGSTRYEEPASGFLLAGRFPASEVERVLGIVEQHGGSLLSKRIEWLASSLSGAAPASTPRRDQRGEAPEHHGSQASVGRADPAVSVSSEHKSARRPAALLRVRAARSRGFGF